MSGGPTDARMSSVSVGGEVAIDGERVPASEPLWVGLGRVNRFQRYRARRAWGWFYAIWAGDVAITLGAAALLTGSAHTDPWVTLVVWLTVSIAVPALAVWSSVWGFREADRMGQVRELVTPPGSSTPVFPIPVWLFAVLLALFLVVEVVLRRDLRFLLFGGALVLWAWLAKVQSETLGRIQPEGRWAIGAHLAALSASIGLVLTNNGPVAPWVWIPVAVIGAVAAVYGITHASQDLAADPY